MGNGATSVTAFSFLFYLVLLLLILFFVLFFFSFLFFPIIGERRVLRLFASCQAKAKRDSKLKGALDHILTRASWKTTDAFPSETDNRRAQRRHFPAIQLSIWVRFFLKITWLLNFSSVRLSLKSFLLIRAPRRHWYRCMLERDSISSSRANQQMLHLIFRNGGEEK